MGYQPALEPKKQGDPKQPEPKIITGKKDTAPQGAGAKFYKAKSGFANWHFNEQAQKRIVEGFVKHGDFSALGGDCTLEGTYEKEGRTGEMKIAIFEEKVIGSDKETRTVVKANLNIDYQLIPLRDKEEKDLMVPPYSGGLLMAMYHYHRFLTLGPKGFKSFGEAEGFSAGGVEPVYVQPLKGAEAKDFKDIRLMADVIRTEYAGVTAKWYFFLR